MIGLFFVIAYTLQIPAFPFPVFLLSFFLNGFGFSLLVSDGLVLKSFCILVSNRQLA